MNFIVIGCGRMGAQLAFSLFQLSHKVTVIDNNSASFTNLPADFLGRTIEGEATHLDVLKRAGIEQANGLAVVTNSDSLNAVIGQVAKNHFNLKNVIVRNYDPVWRTMISAFRLDIVSASSWGAQRIEDKLLNPDFQIVTTVGNGELSIYEFKVSEFLNDHLLSSILPDQNIALISLIRDGNALSIDMSSSLKKDDLVLISATRKGINTLQQYLVSFQENLT